MGRDLDADLRSVQSASRWEGDTTQPPAVLRGSLFVLVAAEGRAKFISGYPRLILPLVRLLISFQQSKPIEERRSGEAHQPMQQRRVQR